MLLFFLVSTLVPIAEDGKLIMWIPEDIHTYLYRPRNISILNRPFFVRIHFGTEWNTSQNIFISFFPFSYFIFPILSNILFIYSFSPTILLLLSQIIFICDGNCSDVSIMLLGNECWFYLFDTYMYFVYISLTNTIRQEPSNGGRIKGVLG